ncbi:MAG: cbb3-type cytochrome oxidase assembly protein CcoS [Bdellovibrionaceae bacterium]|nr:cbb3-type cytochrome oxidase assembly protein CcoS [Pseudobdellovibrionaceae bacterium]MDW8190195.1 cbb3-type cytochrome oxidase assembly protein CcoS [Pseudobdellovibrionaceae bacterium]
MDVILLMIPISLLLSLGFVIAFIWAHRKKQFEGIDLEAMKILSDDPKNNNLSTKEEKNYAAGNTVR